MPQDRWVPGRPTRNLRAAWRDSLVLLGEFWVPLVLFCITILLGGLFYIKLSTSSSDSPESLPAAVYLIISLVFLQPTSPFPDEWYLQFFYFVIPIIGLGIIALGLTDFGILFFNRRMRSKEWQMAVASTFNRHVVLVGLGHLGYRIAIKLYQMGRDVAVIDLVESGDLVGEVRALGIPLIEGDASREAALDSAGICRAQTIVLCTQNDSLNLQIAVKAWGMNPNIEVVIRIFDEEFARALKQQFNFTAISSTGMAAPVFASAAAGVDITRPITVEGRPLSFARLTLDGTASVIGMDIAELEKKSEISVVLLRRGDRQDFHLPATERLQADDMLGVLGSPDQISKLAHECTP